MTIAIFGATGKVGKHTVARALASGQSVVAIVRPGTTTDALAPYLGDRCKLVVGDIFDQAFLGQSLEACDAIISCLGIKRTSAVNPYSSLTSPPDLMRHFAEKIGPVATQLGITRAALVSAAGVGRTHHSMNPPMRLLVKTSKIGVAYRDLADAEDALIPRGWISVRPVTLTNGAGATYRGVTHYHPWSFISRQAVAQAMLDAVTPGAAFAHQLISG